MCDMKFFNLKVGDQLIYGAGDLDNSIKCGFLNIDRVKESGELVIAARCEGGKIVAVDKLFTMNKIKIVLDWEVRIKCNN